MNIGGKRYRTIWLDDDRKSVRIIDQTALPHRFETRVLTRLEHAVEAITAMRVRGAPLIGATAAYGMCLALGVDPSDDSLDRAYALLLATRPTAVNLKWALDDMRAAVRNLPLTDRVRTAYERAAAICDDDIETCRRIGLNGLPLIRAAAARKRSAAINVTIARRALFPQISLTGVGSSSSSSRRTCTWGGSCSRDQKKNRYGPKR